MADLDVSFLLDDPDLASSFQVVRSTATVGTNGRGAEAEAAPVTVLGVVQPAGARDLDRLPDVSRQRGAIKLWTRFRIAIDIPGANGAPETKSDRILWDGSEYTAMSCDPWLYGGGVFVTLAVMDTFA